jgi:DNA-binding NarL/FixJ family response regulator
MWKILIIDDHSVVRAGLRQIVEEELGEARFGEAATAEAALAQLDSDTWDAVILDLSLPDRPGLEVLKSIRDSSPELPVLVLSMHAADQYAHRVLRAGAVCYLTKESAPEELGDAVRSALEGTGQEREQDVEDDCPAAEALHQRLSEREFEVACLIAGGLTVGKIAEQLGLSANTVSTYRCRALAKMQMHTSAQLTSYMIREGLVL